MADDLSQEFFTSAKAQLDAAAKWQVLVLVALLYFQFGIVAPFGAKSAEQHATDIELADQRALQQAIAPAATRAKEFSGQVKDATGRTSEVLLTALVNRFGKLNQIVANLADMPPDSAAGDEGAALFAARPEQLQMQQVQLPDPTNIDLPPMDEGLRRFLAQSGNQVGGGLTPELESYIQAAVIAPAFEQANDHWQTIELPSVEPGADAALEAIADAKVQTVKATTELEALETSVTNLRDQVRALRFAPPAGSAWWRSVAEKGQSIRTMLGALSDGIQSAAQSQLNLAALQSQAEAAIGNQQKASAEIAQELARLEAQAVELQAQLGELGGPLKVIAFKLSLLAPLLPLIIAAVIAGGSLWIAAALRKMCRALTLPIRSEQHANMQAWLKDIAGGTHRRLMLREGLILAVLLVWIVAAICLTRRIEAPLLPHALTAALSVLLVIAARGWLWWWNTEALKMVERPV